MDVEFYFGNHLIETLDDEVTYVPVSVTQNPLRGVYQEDPDRIYTFVFYNMATWFVHWLRVGSEDIFPYIPPDEMNREYNIDIYSNPRKAGSSPQYYRETEQDEIERVRQLIPQRNDYRVTDDELGAPGQLGEFEGSVELVIVPDDAPTEGYIPIRVMGKGSTGRAFLVKRKDNEERYIMKVIQDTENQTNTKTISGLQKAWREIGILSMIPSHKNITHIVRYFKIQGQDKRLFGVKGDGVAIVLEYVEGAITLDEFIKNLVENDATMDKVTMLDMMSQITDGLIHLHKHKIAHLDLKPANILIKTRGGSVVPIIIDYDLSCVVDPTHILACIPGRRGTPLYMAPEMWRVDPLVGDQFYLPDIYSLGAVFYYIVTRGQLPFPKDKVAKIKRDVLTKEPLPVDSGIPSIDALIMQMLSKDSTKRPSLVKVREELVAAIKQV